MKLFDFIKVLFGNGKKANDKWEKLTSYDKSKNAFMTNRLMSAKFPTQANLFNKLRTDPSVTNSTESQDLFIPKLKNKLKVKRNGFLIIKQ